MIKSSRAIVPIPRAVPQSPWYTPNWRFSSGAPSVSIVPRVVKTRPAGTDRLLRRSLGKWGKRGLIFGGLALGAMALGALFGRKKDNSYPRQPYVSPW